MLPSSRMRRLILVLAVLTWPLVGCDDDDEGGLEQCRFDPDCGGGIGGFCQDRTDCATDYCCESDNCGGGTCAVVCDGDLDCPEDMLCEHGSCFFACASDDDCAVGMSCEHGQTICEWEDH